MSSELTRMVEEMKHSLVATIDASTFLDTHGKDREVFEQGYTEFVNNVRKIETYICQYIQVGIFTSMKRRCYSRCCSILLGVCTPARRIFFNNCTPLNLVVHFS